MKIEVQLFAILRERAGQSSIELELAGDATVGDAIRSLSESNGRLAEALEKIDVVMAVNHEYAPIEQVLREGDELALVPPVSGGAGPIQVEITESELSLDHAVGFVTVPEAGAVVTFSGITREVEKLEYEAYRPMAEKKILAICEETMRRHKVLRLAVQHRVGTVPLSHSSVVVAASSGHRPDAFAAAREIIDRLKEQVPIWKKEIDSDRESWVEGQKPGA